MRKKFSFISFVCLPLLACGGSDNNSKTTVKVPDAKTVLDGPGSAAPCKAPDSYTVSSFPKTFVTDSPAAGTTPHYQQIQGLVGSTGSGSTGTVDIINATLIQGSAGTMFANGLVSGTYQIDPTTDFSIELVLWPQLPNTTTTIPDAYLASEQYLAFAGTLTLTAEGGSGMTVSGAFTDLDLIHVNYANNQYTGADDDGSGDACETTISNLSFSGSAAPPQFQGGTVGTTHAPSLTHRFQRSAH